MSDYFHGFEELDDELTAFVLSISEGNKINALSEGAKAVVNDAIKLPKPMSKIHTSGYTHLVRSITWRKSKAHSDVEVGWGKYYGPMVERGTVHSSATPHLGPLYERNKERYEKIMIDALGFKQ